MNKQTGLWSVEWSDLQKCFHIDEVEIGPHSSAGRLLRLNSAGDWTLLAVCPSHADAHFFLDSIEKLLKKKGAVLPKL